MILAKHIMFISALWLSIHTAHAGEADTSCSALSLTDEKLEQAECTTLNNVILVKYLGPIPDSPYATEFDRRKISLARSNEAQNVKTIAGIADSVRGMTLERSNLIQPPLENHIANRTLPKTAQKYRNWNIWIEKIQYGAQGGAQGFAIDCATALNITPQGAIAVAECYPLEEQRRFLRTLNKIKH